MLASTSSAAIARAAAPEDVARLLADRAGVPLAAVKRIDTHAASIFLVGDRAWKLKRPARLSYLDFSTAPRRRAALEAELRLNRRTAPDLYLAVHSLAYGADGALVLDGRPPVDHLLEMRRFDDGALLVERIGRQGIGAELVDTLADAIAAFHRTAKVDRARSGSDRLAEVIEGNAACLAEYREACRPGPVATLIASQRAQFARHAGLLDSRARAGRVRLCHGDLHLANIALIAGKPVPFDCLEFDEALATGDVLYDLSFLLMDLWVRGLRGEANRLMNRYLDRAPENEDGAALMPLLLSVRATVRAHVAAARGARTGRAEDKAEASRLLAGAAGLLAAPAPRLVAIGGRSGTGKSTLARALAPRIGAPPGARILRTDVVRKRRAGVALEERLAPASYTPAESVAVYAALHAVAEQHLLAGTSVVADGAYLKPCERSAIRDLADRSATPFVGLWLVLSLTDRLARVATRGRDASDADAAVVRLQARSPVGALGRWHRLRTAGDIAALVQRASRVLGRGE